MSKRTRPRTGAEAKRRRARIARRLENPGSRAPRWQIIDGHGKTRLSGPGRLLSGQRLVIEKMTIPVIAPDGERLAGRVTGASVDHGRLTLEVCAVAPGVIDDVKVTVGLRWPN